MKTLIIIPAYNEELNIVNTVNKIKKLQKTSEYEIDYIVINDGSRDNTLEICKQNKYHYLNLVNNLGIGGAVQTGYKYALENNYDIAIQFDGDSQHDESFIEKLIKEIQSGSNLVIGSRFIGSESKFKSSKARQLGIKLLSFVIKLCTKEKITDPTSGFRAIDKNVIKLFANNYPTEYPEAETIAIIIKYGYKVKEVPVKMYERKYGKSSIRPIKSFYFMFSVSLSIILTKIRRKRK